MKAKGQNKVKLLEYLGNPSNDFLKRSELAINSTIINYAMKTAKHRNRIKLLEYLGNPANEFLNRVD